MIKEKMLDIRKRMQKKNYYKKTGPSWQMIVSAMLHCRKSRFCVRVLCMWRWAKNIQWLKRRWTQIDQMKRHTRNVRHHLVVVVSLPHWILTDSINRFLWHAIAIWMQYCGDLLERYSSMKCLWTQIKQMHHQMVYVTLISIEFIYI